MTIFSAITAGIFISIGLVFYITVTTNTVNISYDIAKLVGSVCFSMELILILCSRADLFISTVSTIIPKATNKITYKKMRFLAEVTMTNQQTTLVHS